MIAGTFYYANTNSTASASTWDGQDTSGATWCSMTTYPDYLPAEPIKEPQILPKAPRSIYPVGIVYSIRHDAIQRHHHPQDSRRVMLRNTNRVKPFPHLKQVPAGVL